MMRNARVIGDAIRFHLDDDNVSAFGGRSLGRCARHARSTQPCLTLRAGAQMGPRSSPTSACAEARLWIPECRRRAACA
jgi:hypothetical protein